MVHDKQITVDNEFLLLSEFADSEVVNQRALSKKLGISLGTINTLINKMAREGKIKMEQVSSKQVAYMLTPKGMLEKANKTAKYLKHHYRVIYQTKEKIKHYIDQLALNYETIYIIKSADEIGDIVDIAISEYNQNLSGITVMTIDTNDLPESFKGNSCAILNTSETNIEQQIKHNDCKVIHLLGQL